MSVQNRPDCPTRAERRFVLTTLVITAIFAAADALWLPHSHIVVSSVNFTRLANGVMLFGAIYCVGWGVMWRLRSDSSRIARYIKMVAGRLSMVSRATLVSVPMGFAGGVFMYLASGAGLPLMDGQLAEIDKMLGFDWLAVLSAVNANPVVADILVFAYHSVGPQTPAAFLLLVLAGQEVRLLELVTLIALVSLMTGIGMVLVPASGAYPFYAPPPEAFSSLTSDAGMWHYEELMKLRSGEPFVYLADQSKGLVTFPSFHTALGVVIAYALRGLRWIFPAVALLNATMIVATIPEGGHHLIDVLAGLAISAICIWFARVLKRGAFRPKCAWAERLTAD